MTIHAYKYLVVLDETLAGDELDRVNRFLNDIATVCPIQSMSGLIRHVEQFAPMVSLPMLAGDPSLASSTGIPLLAMRYTPSVEGAGGSSGVEFNREQIRLRLSTILQQCSHDAERSSAQPATGFVPGDLTKIVSRYEVIVCVRPTRGEGASLTQGDQLVCQLAESSQQPLWRCPPAYTGIHRVVVAWPDAITGQALLVSAARLAEQWNVPFCVMSAGGKRHQQSVDGELEVVCEKSSLPECELLTCEHLEDISRCVNSDDLLVMGAYGRWWPWRLVTASHTETILQDLNCPALLLPGRHETSANSAASNQWLSPIPIQSGNETANGSSS